MLTKPKYGWTDLTLNNENYYRASYLTDVPFDLLEAFNDSLQDDKEVNVEFDAEGWEYELRCNEKGSKIAVDDYSDIEDSSSKKTIYDLAKELIQDIERYFEDWIEWDCGFEYLTETEKAERRESLQEELQKLRELIN